MEKTTPTKPRPEGKGWVWDESEQRWFRIRKLTPRECYRLMDVPEDKIDQMMASDETGKLIVSNSQHYKCAGNSICVGPMAECYDHLLFPKDEYLDGIQLGLFF